MKSSFLEFIWIWDKIQNLNLPKHHRKMAVFLTDLYQNRKNGLLMAFRNSGKSTIVGLFGAWLLTQDPNLRLLILSADHNLAKKMVHHMRQIIERHPLTVDLKPKNSDEWASDRFTVRRPQKLRDPSVLAAGLMANTTGCRADIIICDDVEIPKTCDTAGKRTLLRQKLGELDYILTPQGFMLFIGTPHTADTLYKTDVGGYLENWATLKIPILDKGGQSAWPERFSLEKIEKLRIRSGPNKFLSQMMLKPVLLMESRLDINRLKFYDGDLVYRESNGRAILTLNGIRLKSVSCWWDPAFGSPNGDKSVVACVFFDEAGNAYLHRLLYLCVPSQAEATAYQCAAVRELVQNCFIPSVHLETNGIGKFLPALLRQEFAKTHTSCAVLEETSRQNKVARIVSAFDAPLMNGSLWVHESVKSTPFLDEMRDFQTHTNTHDDGLDAVAGCLLAEPVHIHRPWTSFTKQNLEWRF
ncbi:MAG: phage terminase large subunit [Alphaproteobacteria bacterium]|nr:phage terminase large subunit [Alphaproteobacteria bacterium]